MPPTHEVTNQPPPLTGYDVFGQDAALVEGLEREGGGWAADDLHRLGLLAGSQEARDWGAQANAHPPVLHTHDRWGNRRDEVTYHPAYHGLMEVAVWEGLAGALWSAPPAGAHVARAAKYLVWQQVEAGHLCPITMSYAAVPALRAQPDLAAAWEPHLLARVYDPAFAPAEAKKGALFGMAMTEKQGGSDVRANTTRAEPSGDTWRLTGHKWFCSAPMSDAFLVLAQAPGGLSCFLLPRWRPDGAVNALAFQRLKDKLGNRSNASSEVEFHGATAWLVGEQGRGVRTIIEMVAHTRLDCVLGSASQLRQGIAEASHHAAHRSAFGRELADQPLMRQVLADLAVESEAATALALRLARAYDAGRDPAETAFRRLATAIGKYWVCKRATPAVGEALECLGGNGFVEDSGMPRVLRETPLNSIWEGAGNVICLDVLRALERDPDVLDVFMAEVGLAAGGDARLDRAVARLEAALRDDAPREPRARRLVEQMALVLQGALLVRHSHPAVADAFVASRLDGDWGHAFGTLPGGLDTGAIVERARPKRG
jgi:putative acyl-CoA dehydrogenase